MNKLKYSFFALSLIFILAQCQKNTLNSKTNQDSQFSPKVTSLLKQMTLKEKVGQMNLYNGFYDVTGPSPKSGDAKLKYDHIKTGMVGAMLNVTGAEEVRKLQALAVENSRLGIPMLFGYDVIHGYRTTFPIPLAESASWNLDLIKKSARISAIEASAVGLNWTFAPMVDISRDARWGRVMEGAGEDPFLGSAIAKARVEGFQGENLSDANTIAACTKHFAGYGFAESGKDYNTVDVGTSTLYNIILPPFKATVDADVLTFMNAFNELNGIPATADKFIQRDILKSEWNFDGFVVSDWGSIIEMIDHGYVENGLNATKTAAQAGCDMDMESHLYIKHLESLVNNNSLSIDVLNDAVGRILTVKEKLGLFDDPYKYCNEARQNELLLHPDHITFSREIAEESIVLLKNENNILPLPKETKNIAIIGDLADDKNSPLGNWRLGSIDNSATSIIEGIKQFENVDFNYTQGVSLYSGQEKFVEEISINNGDTTGFAQAIELAQKSEIVIMVLGEHGFQTGEGRSRADIGLPGLQQQLLEEVYRVNKNIVLVTMSGRPLAIEWAANNVPVILHSWHLGSQSGNAIANVLFGKVNPSGKMPMTTPRSSNQIPIYYNHKSTGRPGPKKVVFWSHYIDQTNAPLYPFGFGLSYSEFEYSNLNAMYDPIDKTLNVNCSVQNVSGFDGKEIVQLYIRDKSASITRPVKELKGFKKLLIKGNSSSDVSFKLTSKDLGFYTNNGNFITENGEFDIMVGGNSSDVLVSTVTVNF